MTETPYIFESTQENFARLVLENSRKGPVLVNYWAPWAGPCLKLWPVLERLAREYSGKFLLVNINTDQQKQLAKSQGINSLPTIKVYRNEKVVDEVHGAESERSFRALIDKHVAQPSDAVVIDAVRNYHHGRVDEAFALLRDANARNPENQRTAITYAKLLFREGQYAEVERVLNRLPKDKQNHRDVPTLLAHAGFMGSAAAALPEQTLVQALEENPDDLEARYQLSALNLLRDDYEGAMQQLLEIMRRDRTFRDDVGRKGLTAIFDILGREHELARRYRTQMLIMLS